MTKKHCIRSFGRTGFLILITALLTFTGLGEFVPTANTTIKMPPVPWEAKVDAPKPTEKIGLPEVYSQKLKKNTLLLKSLSAVQREKIAAIFSEHKNSLKTIEAETRRQNRLGREDAAVPSLENLQELAENFRSFKARLDNQIEGIFNQEQRTLFKASQLELLDPDPDYYQLKKRGLAGILDGNNITIVPYSSTSVIKKQVSVDSEKMGKRFFMNIQWLYQKSQSWCNIWLAGIKPAFGSEGISGPTDCYYGYLYNYYTYLYEYYAYTYAYYGYLATGNAYAYYGYVYSYYSYVYAELAYKYCYDAYIYSDSTAAYYGYLYSYYAYLYAYYGYEYNYYAYTYTGNDYCYYAYIYSDYGYTYAYYGYSYANACYNDNNTQNILGVPLYQQEQNQWCWAGTAQMIMDYSGPKYSQCEMANFIFGQNYCCSYPSSWACNQGAYDYQISNNYWHYGFNNTLIYSYLSFSEIQGQINSNLPFNMHWSWTGGGGHAMAVKGYDASMNYVYFNDPWEPQSKVCAHAACITTSNHSWNSTVYNIYQ